MKRKAKEQRGFKNPLAREDRERWRQYQGRIRRQEARTRNGTTGAASMCRRLDPATGEVIEEVAKTKVRLNKVATGEAEAGDLRALRVLERVGRGGAPASWLADTAAKGEAKAISLVKRGLAAVTRSNRFVLTKWADKTVPPLVAWDEPRKEEDVRRIGMVEPLPTGERTP